MLAGSLTTRSRVCLHKLNDPVVSGWLVVFHDVIPDPPTLRLRIREKVRVYVREACAGTRTKGLSPELRESSTNSGHPRLDCTIIDQLTDGM